LSNPISDCSTAFTPGELRVAQKRAFFPFGAHGLAFTSAVTAQKVAYAGTAAATAPLVLKPFHVDPNSVHGGLIIAYSQIYTTEFYSPHAFEKA